MEIVSSTTSYYVISYLRPRVPVCCVRICNSVSVMHWQYSSYYSATCSENSSDCLLGLEWDAFSSCTPQSIGGRWWVARVLTAGLAWPVDPCCSAQLCTAANNANMAREQCPSRNCNSEHAPRPKIGSGPLCPHHTAPSHASLSIRPCVYVCTRAYMQA